MTLDIAAIKARADKATAGGWIVIETTHPYKFTPSRPEFKGEGFHVERRIATAWDHPQLKDKYPLVNIATGIGTPESGAVHMCSIEADDADFIAHARTDIPALIAALEASKSARVKAEQERDALRNFVADFADANIEMLPMPHIKHPADEPDKAVSAAEVWEWQSDARRALEQKS